MAAFDKASLILRYDQRKDSIHSSSKNLCVFLILCSLQIKLMGQYDPHSVGSFPFFKRREMVALVSEGGREPCLMDSGSMLRRRGTNMSDNVLFCYAVTVRARGLPAFHGLNSDCNFF